MHEKFTFSLLLGVELFSHNSYCEINNNVDLSSVKGIKSWGLSSINCDHDLNKGWRKHRKAMSVLNQGGEEAVECPLCMEPLEVDDLNFFPCTCGYQICRFCWHRIRTDENGLCPACRKAYSENPADFKPLSKEEIARWIQFFLLLISFYFNVSAFHHIKIGSVFVFEVAFK